MTESPGKHRICFVTTARSEYFQMRPVIRAFMNEVDFDVAVCAGGAHLSRDHGYSIAAIERDGVPIAARLETLASGDTLLDAAHSAATTVSAFADALVEVHPDLVFIFGDRYEHLAIALAARSLGLAIAHVHGGEVTEGARDERFRHAISKLSDLHFVTTAVYAARLEQMGEESARICLSGAPFVDLVCEVSPKPVSFIESSLGIAVRRPLALVAYHPATGSDEDARATIQDILHATLARCKSVVISGPNHDPGFGDIEAAALAVQKERSGEVVYRNYFGDELFQSLMCHTDVMIGKSSAGLHEALYRRAPVVDVGARQAGRLAAANVVHCDADVEAIAAAIDTVLHPSFRAAIPAEPIAFGQSPVSHRIVTGVRERWSLLSGHAEKRFRDLDGVRQAGQSWRQAYA